MEAERNSRKIDEEQRPKYENNSNWIGINNKSNYFLDILAKIIQIKYKFE